MFVVTFARSQLAPIDLDIRVEFLAAIASMAAQCEAIVADERARARRTRVVVGAVLPPMVSSMPATPWVGAPAGVDRTAAARPVSMRGGYPEAVPRSSASVSDGAATVPDGRAAPADVPAPTGVPPPAAGADFTHAAMRSETGVVRVAPVANSADAGAGGPAVTAAVGLEIIGPMVGTGAGVVVAAGSMVAAAGQNPASAGHPIDGQGPAIVTGNVLVSLLTNATTDSVVPLPRPPSLPSLRISLPGQAATPETEGLGHAPLQRLPRGSSLPLSSTARDRFKVAATAVRASRRIMYSSVMEMEGAEHATAGTVTHGEACAALNSLAPLMMFMSRADLCVRHVCQRSCECQWGGACVLFVEQGCFFVKRQGHCD